MDILSKLLDTAAFYGVFSYHPNCKRIKLTHLCFADDLMIFTKGNMDSIVGVQNILKLFYTYFGLKLNCEKNELFSIGISRASFNRTSFRIQDWITFGQISKGSFGY